MYDAELQHLLERIASHTQIDPKPSLALLRADRWILSSNLQKAIRRGLIATALQSATQLAVLDSEYMWRRLVVIAFEDVGLAAQSNCVAVLKVFRRKALREKLGEQRTLQYMVTVLCQSVKSRSLCDAIATVDFSEPKKYGPSLSPLNVVLDPARSISERVISSRSICGWTSNNNGVRRPESRVNRRAMEAVAAALGLSPDASLMFLRGNGVSDYMNVPVPVIDSLVRSSSCTLVETPQSFDGKDGILYAALDRHCRLGKESLKRFLTKLPHSLFPMKDRIGALGAAVFVVEGSCLDRSMRSPELDSIKGEFEATFLRYYGASEGAASDLIAAVREGRPKLNEMRDEVLG